MADEQRADPTPQGGQGGTRKIDVGGTGVTLLFEEERITEDLQDMIAGDLERVLSSTDHVTWEPKRRSVVWRGRTITHELRGWRTAQHPDAIRQFFGGGVTANGAPHALVVRELADAYREARDREIEYPEAFARLGNFLAFLADREKLQGLAEDVVAARQRIYFHGCTAPQNADAFRELTRYADLRVNPPSILDIQPLGALTRTDTPDDAVLALAAAVVDKEHAIPAMRIPLGAYVDGEWHILVVSLP